MIPVILESPYAGATKENEAYAVLAMRDSLNRGEAPMVSHLLYTRALSDDVREERELGMRAGWAWLVVAARVVVYVDRGISAGMRAGIDEARKAGRDVVLRSLTLGTETWIGGAQ
jgi:hypothetical protein